MTRETRTPTAIEASPVVGEIEAVAWRDSTYGELHKIILDYQKRDMVAAGGRQAERAANYSIALVPAASLASLQSENQALREEVERLTKERNEARADLEWMEVNRNRWQDATTVARRQTEAFQSQVQSLTLKLEERDKALAAERKRATNAEYMANAYYNMLGPIGQSVAKKWKATGVQRVHFSWGPDADKMTGEERAQFILDLDHLPTREVFPGEIDGDARALQSGGAEHD